MGDGFWMLLIGLACYASLGFALLWLTLRSQRRIEAIAEELRPRQPGHRRSGVVIRWPRRSDWEALEDKA